MHQRGAGACDAIFVQIFNYSDNFIESLPILPQNSAKRLQYRLAATTVEAFLRVQVRSGATDWQTPTILYPAAAAEMQKQV